MRQMKLRNGLILASGLRLVPRYVRFHAETNFGVFVASFAAQIIASQFFFYELIGWRIYPVIDDDRHMTVLFAITALVISPPLETLVLQVLPYELARKITAPTWVRFLVMWLVFFLAHLPSGLETAFQAGAIGGFFLCAAYVIARRSDAVRAYAAIVVVHFLVNAILALYIVQADVS